MYMIQHTIGADKSLVFMLPPLPLVMLVLSKGRKVSDGGYTAPGLFIPSPQDTEREEFCPNFSTKTNFREK